MWILHHTISVYDQIPDRFCIISMECLSLSGRCSFSRNISQWQWARKKVCFHRLGNWTVKMSLLFYFALIPVNVVVGYQVFSKVFSRWQKLWRRWRWKKLAPVSRAVQGLTPPPPPPAPLENFWNLGLSQYISSILEQELEFLNRTQTSLNFGFFIQWQQMNNFFF